MRDSLDRFLPFFFPVILTCLPGTLPRLPTSFSSGGLIAPGIAHVQRGPSDSGREWADCSSLRASREHCFILRPPRARRVVRGPVDSFQAALLDFAIQF